MLRRGRGKRVGHAVKTAVGFQVVGWVLAVALPPGSRGRQGMGWDCCWWVRLSGVLREGVGGGSKAAGWHKPVPACQAGSRGSAGAGCAAPSVLDGRCLQLGVQGGGGLGLLQPNELVGVGAHHLRAGAGQRRGASATVHGDVAGERAAQRALQAGWRCSSSSRRGNVHRQQLNAVAGAGPWSAPSSWVGGQTARARPWSRAAANTQRRS